MSGTPSEGSTALRSELETAARSLGFVRFGVARAVPLETEGERLRVWLERGYHGSMKWMETTAEVRADPSHEGMLPGSLSVVVLVTPYGARAGIGEREGLGRIARYAQGRDYHTVLRKRLRKLVALLRGQGFQARASVDSLPVFERAWAERAGVGFVGKNCCLIVPGLGSHVFLSTLVTDASLPNDAPMKSRCGSCRLCLDACPTEAFVEPRSLDARKCISYLTIEHRESMPAELEEQVGPWLFGCDVCQDVCPYNHGRGDSLEDTEHAAQPDAFAPHPRFVGLGADAWLTMDQDAFAAHTEASPLRRPGRDSMARNAAVVLGNVGERRHLVVLDKAHQTDRSEQVREAAARASRRLLARLDRG